MVSPDIANAPRRHHTRHHHPTVCPPARRTATSSDKNPAGSHAQLAENERIAPRVKGWLEPQPAQAPAARRQRPLLWSSQSGALRGGSARPSCARWAHRKLSGQPLEATGCGARAGSVARAPYTKSILEACGSAISALVCGKAFPLQILELVIESLPARTKGGADRVDQPRKGRLLRGRWVKDVECAGRKVGRTFQARRLGATYHLQLCYQPRRTRPGRSRLLV